MNITEQELNDRGITFHPHARYGEQYSFGSPLESTMYQLELVLDCYSANPEGPWPERPMLKAPIEQYDACLDILKTVRREARSRREKLPEKSIELHCTTVGEFILARIDDPVIKNRLVENILLKV